MGDTKSSSKGRVGKKELVRVNGQKLTPKQAKFVRGIAQGKPGTHAALEAYDTDDYETAHAIAAENLQKPTIRDAIEAAMVKLEITPELAVKPVAEALNFNHEDDKTRLEMRLKGHDRAMRLMGVDNQDKGGNTINFNFGGFIQE